MGTSTLEARLRARLIVVLAPMLGIVASAAVLGTARALDGADDDRARATARSVAESVRVERAEGDSFADATREATSLFDPKQIRVLIDANNEAGPLGSLSVGECKSLILENGMPWRACALDLDGLRVTAAIPTDADRRALRSLMEWMLGTVGLALIGSLLSIRVALRAPLRSLAELVDWVERVPSGAQLGPPRDATIEIAKLAQSFEGLVAELTEALAREKANSAHIAHELRTPLTAIVAELAVMTPSAAVSRLREDASRLSRVIDTILLLSEPRSTKRADVVVNVADLARKLGQDVAPVDAPDEALVYADPHLLELAIFNLLENATKYAAGTPIRVRVARESDAVRVSVVDGGPGLAVEVRDRVFDRYWREASDGPGRGLGLALVRAVAERHGGTASARAAEGQHGADVGFSVGPLLGWHR
ncbi:MAG TPA: HAMP domain-containing sensor histidine kinase [Polyangiaceae bacterium]|nr:HAMP domain-containing sensor histidine kinase [Polyangiaceae bacterium]